MYFQTNANYDILTPLMNVNNRMKRVKLMMMSVIKLNSDGTSALACIHLNEVDYMEIEGRKIVYYINNEKYRHISTLSEMEEYLSEHGFDMLDKTNLVNLNRVVKFDDSQGKVYFQETVTPQSKFATVAYIKQKMIRKEMVRKTTSNVRDILKRLKLSELKQQLMDY
jgi:DNA-binding LytR/AlgR family response regulator